METFLKQLRDNWILLVALVSMIIWSANVNTQLAQAQKERDEIFNLLDVVYEIQIDVAVIKEKISKLETQR